ncbi:MAG: preprotein translocase subunit SecD [Thermosediminibacterales bacterium]|nr:preprotein translocase subunit SecD [Thermosediminibacterales bacterium]
MNTKNILKLLIILTMIAALGYVSINGLKIGEYKVIPVKEGINLGLDLQGGVYVLLEAQENEGQTVTNEKMMGAVEVIRGRVDELGVAEPIIARQGEKRIRVELPGVKDTEKALSIIGQTASLRFIGPDKSVVLTGNDVKDARAIYGPNNEPMVSLKLNPEGKDKFAEATEKFLGQRIAIYLDERIISAPVVESVITAGEAVIEGLPNIDKAGELAMLIRAGALPVDLTIKEIRAVGPSLGADSLERSLNAGQIGLILVLLYMIAYYRLPGLIANFALILYIIIVLMIFVGLRATLTLPGVAGLILSIGMAVDANVIIFERIKEELKNGKTLRASIDSGFARAFRAILDANVTTLIAAGVLFYLGSGPIRGFAVTLSIGILVSMFTAIVVTKYMLKLLVNAKIATNIKLYGA